MRSHPDLSGYDYTSLFDNVVRGSEADAKCSCAVCAWTCADTCVQGLNHSLNLSSAYTEEIPYSNYTPTFIGTIAVQPSCKTMQPLIACFFSGIIDYIWYSAEYLNPAALLGPVDEVSVMCCEVCCFWLHPLSVAWNWDTAYTRLLTMFWSQDYINEHVDGCPNAHFASDHMALSTQFNFYD